MGLLSYTVALYFSLISMVLVMLLHPSYFEIESLDKRKRQYRSVGWIYVLRNQSFKDEVYKVGQSRRPPSVRASELSSSTAVYHPFELVFFIHASDRDVAEGLAHNALRDYRKVPNKEFFEAPLHMIIGTFCQIAQQLPIVVGKRIIEQPLGIREYKCEICGSTGQSLHILIPIKKTCKTCGQMTNVVIE